MIVRYAAYLAVAGVALAPAAARADRQTTPAAAAITLRAHFVAGQDDAYTLRSTAQQRVTAASAGGASQRTTTVTTGAIRDHIVSVDRTGGATADIIASNARVTVTPGGQTPTTATIPTTTQRAYLGADGSLRAIASGDSTSASVQSFDVQAFHALPSGRVTVGATWTAPAALLLPRALGASRPPTYVATRYRLAGLRPHNGHTLATLVATNSATLPLTTTIQGAAVDVRLQESTTAQTVFDVTAGRVGSTTAHEVLRLTLKPAGAASGSTGTTEDITSDTSLQTA